MNVKSILIVSLCIALALPLVGCSKDYSQYAQAVKEQNITQQLRIETEQREREYTQQKHEAKMLALAGNLINAAAATDSKNDDMMVPLIIMMMEDKWAMAQANANANTASPQLVAIEAPETTGEVLRSSTGLVLGLGGLALGIIQSNNLTEVATAGMAAAGTHNVVSGENNTLKVSTTDSNNRASGADSSIGDTISTQTTGNSSKSDK